MLTAGGRLLRDAAIGAWLAIAVGAVGGLASVLELLFTPDVRAWNRISILIAFFSLLSVGVLLDALRRRLGRRRLGRRRHGGALGLIALAGVLLFGVYDQTSDSYVPPYRVNRPAMEKRSGISSARSKPGFLPGSRRLRAPLRAVSRGVSGNARQRPGRDVRDKVRAAARLPALRAPALELRAKIKGRPADRPAALAGQPLRYVLAAAGAAGMTGLWIDPAGFEAAKSVRLRAALRATLHESAVSKSPDGDL